MPLRRGRGVELLLLYRGRGPPWQPYQKASIGDGDPPRHFRDDAPPTGDGHAAPRELPGGRLETDGPAALGREALRRAALGGATPGCLGGALELEATWCP